MDGRIGRYELVKPLAEGDRGKLYLARSTGFGGFARHVIIKTFEGLPGAAEGPFIEETLSLGRLHHQHITPVLDVGRDGERFFVVLDFVHGRSAREVWQQTFTLGALLPLDFSLTVVAAAASGLHYAHTRRRPDGGPLGLVHGHVSLSNVVIGFDGSVQLIGFAGASARGLRASETQLGFAKDQLAYLAPEQARRQGLDARSDVFALGILLYELTTMRRAFRDDSDRLTIERIKIGSYVQPRAVLPELPAELDRIITRALQVEPAARYPDAEAMRRELVALGHHLELVLGDAAIVEVMAQLFADGDVDPWTTAHADRAPDAAEPAPQARRRPLRAATETVDALAIELEIPIEQAGRLQTPTTPEAAALDDDRAKPAGADDTRATLPTPALADDTRATLPVAALAAGDAAATDDTRATLPVDAIAPALAPRRGDAPPAPGDAAPAVPNDTDGVPVVVPLPAPATTRDDTPAPAPAAKAAAAVAPVPRARRGFDMRIAVGLGAVATAGVTAAVALALRGSGDDTSARDAAAVPVAIDAPPPIDASIDAPVDAPPDASTTVQLRITSTPANATVVLDGKRLGKTPFEGTVDRDEGTHVLKLRLSGHVSVRVDVELTGDVVQDLTLAKAVPVDAGADPPDE